MNRIDSLVSWRVKKHYVRTQTMKRTITKARKIVVEDKR